MIVVMKLDRLTAWILPALLLLFGVISVEAQQLEQQNPPIPAERPIADHPVDFRDIPLPPKQNWIVDLTGSVSAEATDYINRVCDEVKDETNREMCVVVVNRIQGSDHKAYATNLFNDWGTMEYCCSLQCGTAELS